MARCRRFYNTLRHEVIALFRRSLRSLGSSNLLFRVLSSDHRQTPRRLRSRRQLRPNLSTAQRAIRQLGLGRLSRIHCKAFQMPGGSEDHCCNQLQPPSMPDSQTSTLGYLQLLRSGRYLQELSPKALPDPSATGAPVLLELAHGAAGLGGIGDGDVDHHPAAAGGGYPARALGD